MIIKGIPPFSNTYIIKRFDQAILIDPSYNYEEITKRLKGYQLVAILLTHAHVHHLNLIGYFNCPIYIHRKEYKVLINDELNGYAKTNLEKTFSHEKLYIKFLDDKSRISLADKSIKTIHTPGHSEGSVCYVYDNLVFVGDTVNNKGIGKIKKLRGAKAQMKNSIKKLFKLIPEYYNIYPGHGESFVLGEIKRVKNIKDVLK